MTTEALTTAGSAVGLAAVVLSIAAFLVSRSLRVALPVLLDLLLAAGLLHLAAIDTWQSIASAAAVVGIRKLATSALTSSGRASSPLLSRVQFPHPWRGRQRPG